MGAQCNLSIVVILFSIGLYFTYPQLTANSTSKMSSFAAIRASNAAIKHSTSSLPVAVFVGGTSGIGQAMAEVFANNTQGNSHIVIVGRNRAAAEKIFSTFPTPSVKGATKEFVRCDATLMKNVELAAKDVLKRHSKINYLVMSPGVMIVSGRDETLEGIDKKLAVHYYARWKFLHDLLPALERASADGEKTSVMSVLSPPGKSGLIFSDDLPLRRHYSLGNAAQVARTYNDLMMDSFAERSPSIPFIHADPGGVRTSLLSSSTSWVLRYTSVVLNAVARPLTVSAAECGEYMWHAIYSSATAPGSWRTGSRGEDPQKNENPYATPEHRKNVWEHTVQTMNDALKTNQ